MFALRFGLALYFIAASLLCPIVQSAEVAPPKPAEESRAIRWAKQDVETNEKLFGPESLATAKSLLDLGQLHYDAGNVASALALFERAALIRKKRLEPGDPAIAASLFNLANAHLEMGDLASAGRFYREAQAIIEAKFGPDDPQTAYTLQFVATYYQVSGDFSKAESAKLRILKIYENARGPSDPMTALALNGLGAVYGDMGDYAKATQLHHRALAICEETLGPDHLETAVCLLSLAVNYISLRNYTNVEPMLRRALEIHETKLGPDKWETAVCLQSLAAFYHITGDYGKAQPLYERALEINEKRFGTDHRITAATLNELAVLYQHMGAYDRADPLFWRILPVLEKTHGAGHPMIAMCLECWACNQIALGRSDDALSLGLRAHTNRVQGLSHILSFTAEQPRLAYQGKYGPYDLFAMLGHAPQAALAVVRFKGVVLDSLIEDRLVAASSQSPEQRTKVEQLRATKQRLTHLLLEVPRDLSEEAKGRRTTERETLTQQADQMEADLARHFAGLGRARRALSVTVPEVQKALPHDAVLMELIRYIHYLGKDQKEPRYGAVLIFPSGEPKWLPLGSAAAIEQNIARYQESVRGSAGISPAPVGGSPNGTQFSAVLQALYQQLWAPVQDVLPKNVKTIILSPDGELSFVSFATLLTPDQQFLAQKYSLRYVASGRDLLPRFQPPKSKKLAVYANPDFSGQGVLAANPSTNALLAMREVELRDFRSVQLPPLQGTAKESAALVSWAKTWGWPTESYVAAEASEAQLRAVESPYILHLATHGFFLPEEKPEETENELGWRGIGGVRPPSPSGLSMEPDSLMRPRIFLKNPMHRSGLALAGAQTTLDAWKRGDVPPTDNDGIVTADEVGTLNLDSTWLVVLSACDTGAGEARSGEGVLGLRRGFVQAGAQNLLLTLWKIRDEETAKFMVNFYDAAHASGDAAQALAEVQRDWLVKLRKERGLQAAVQLAGPFILSSQGEVK